MYITSFSSRGVAQPGSASALGAEGPRFESVHPDQNIMNKAKIYSPAKTSMQSGRGKSKNWILEFDILVTSSLPFFDTLPPFAFLLS